MDKSIALMTPAWADGFASVFEMVQETIWKTPWTGWLIFAGGILGGLVVGRLAAALLRGLGKKFKARGLEAYDIVVCAVARPVALAVFGLGLSIGLSPLELHPGVREAVMRGIALIYIISLGAFCYYLVELSNWFLHRIARHRKRRSTLDDQIAPLVRKTLRIIVVLVFVLFAAQNVLKADIGAWLAGLGIAGLAVSLAAQDSIKNLFGSIVIFLDRPFVVGERIQFDKWEGPVEEIGFRSTKLRMAGGEQVLIPNSKLADAAIVNLDRRLYTRRTISLTLAKDTPVEKVEAGLAALRGVLADPAIAAKLDERHPAHVWVEELSASGPVIKLNYWMKQSETDGYLEHSEAVNLKVLKALAGAEVKWG